MLLYGTKNEKRAEKNGPFPFEFLFGVLLVFVNGFRIPISGRNCGNIVLVKSYFGSTVETHNFYENVLTDIQWVNMNISTCRLVDLRAKKLLMSNVCPH